MTKEEIKNWILENAITKDEWGTEELDLSGVDMSGIKINFSDAKTGNVEFESAKTKYVNFERAETGYVFFRDAKTKYVDFRYTDTWDVYFKGAKTRYVNFRDAETGPVDFMDAETEDIYFRNAKTGLVDFKYAKTGPVGFEGAETEYFYTPKDKVLYKGEWHNYVVLDGITSVIAEDKRRNGIGVFKDINGWYIATNGRISYHSIISYDEAKRGLKEKKKRILADFKPFIKKCKKQGYITIKEFRKKTGACKAGTNAWLKENKIEIKDEYEWDYALEMFEKHPTMETNLILNTIKEMEND